jgi:hypothetical protein
MPSHDYDPSKDTHYVAKIQAFVSGGFEVTLIAQDLHKIAYLMDSPRTGVRDKTEQKENDVISSVNRSKKKIRYLIKSMGCDRLLTLTKRENDPENYMTTEQWADCWDRFNRLCKKAGVALQYVAVLERHKKGNYHLHAAIVGKVSVNLIRGIWQAITGGKGSGNVDIAMRRNCTDHQRRAGLAKYVSKYVAKQIGQTEFNKKRYWSTRHKLPTSKRYILKANEPTKALQELCQLLALSFSQVAASVFMFPSGLGAWFSFDDNMSLPPPF